jgi:citrate lyase subunit beta/citryl-CoA lyase
MLMTPGNRPERLAKAASYGADALIFDLEDSVPPAEKARARQCVAEALRAKRSDGPELCVRINSPGTAHGAADLAALPLDLIDSLMVPKVESPDTLLELERRFSSHDVELIVTLETPRGILNALAIADATPRTTALFFGSGDYTAALGAAPTDAVMHYPRSVIVAAAAAAGIQAIDAAFFQDVKSADAMRRDSQVARELGFVGKVVFHPVQVAIANEIFSPTRSEVARAKLLLSSYRESLAKGLGTSVTDGVFAAVDLVPPAERLIRMAEMLAAREGRS